jgi:hypothetical protein
MKSDFSRTTQKPRQKRRGVYVVRPEGFEPPAYCSVADHASLVEIHELEDSGGCYPWQADYLIEAAHAWNTGAELAEAVAA